jgi:ABC-type nitrate/sulfonate/bicarbonate transport system ATPase subunit/flavin-dependent dehydrogenase
MVTGHAPLGEGASLQIVEVSKAFAGTGTEGSQTQALESLSLTIASGELVSIIGPSGCGKSTLLRLVAGLDVPDSGELRIGNEPIIGPSADRGLVFQDPNLFPWLSVSKNIQSGLVARGLLKEKRHEVEEFMRLVGLEGFANAFPHHLSGGMAQRVALARALINHPKVLLLDEPLGALDAFTRMRLQDEVLRLWRARGTTILLVTHDIDEAIYMSDRIVLMTPRPGRMEACLEVALPRPRQRNSPEFLHMRGEILERLHLAGASSPSAAAQDSPKPTDPSPLGKSGHAPPSTIFSETDEGNWDAQVIIVGGGPAGSTLGAYLGQAGIKNIILDQAVHPRPHVGESLVCSTTKIFEEIGFLPVMEREKFVRKHGAVWTSHADDQEHLIRFREIPELGLTQDYTYHVDRSRFDQLLLAHAEKKGSQTIQGARAAEVLFNDQGAAVGVRVSQGGKSKTLRARIIVDASGRSTILGSQLHLKQHDPLFDQFAIHNWFENVDRGPIETRDFIHIHVLNLPCSWLWLIPISDTVTSVGIVTKASDFPKSAQSAKSFFEQQVRSHPLIARRMANARPVHEFSREGNFSYVMKQFAGDGWLLLGDAARFVDPVFSSGVSVAIESARRAADAIVQALNSDDVSASAFAAYERTARQGVNIWRDFILLYYQLPPLFLEMISRADSRAQLTRLLQGDVYDRASVPLLEKMRERIREVAALPHHPWHSQLSTKMLACS